MIIKKKEQKIELVEEEVWVQVVWFEAGRIKLTFFRIPLRDIFRICREATFQARIKEIHTNGPCELTTLDS